MEIKDRSFIEIFFFFSLLFFIVFIPISIASSQVFYTLSSLLLIIILIKNKKKIRIPAFFIPLGIYAILTIFSAIFSVRRDESLKDIKEILLFLIVILIFNSIKDTYELKILNYAISIPIILSSILSFLQFYVFPSIEKRATGFLSHYMTQAGIMLLIFSVSLGLFLGEKKNKKIYWLFIFILSTLALIFTMTRGAWIGAIFSAFLIFIIYKPKFALSIPMALVIFFLVSPENIKQRALSTFSLEDASNRDRIYMLEAGIKIIKSSPVLGGGPNTIKYLYADKKYRPAGAKKTNPHLHNNIIQISAERGIPALITWLSFIIFSFILLYKKWKKSQDPYLKHLSLGILGGVLGFFISGFFEYNFGDSEVKMLFLYLISAPLAIKYNGENGNKKD
ncbi:MAG: O-antigen ligase family protein [Acidobacteriota bacterium]